jgi:hypothetical protein
VPAPRAGAARPDARISSSRITAANATRSSASTAGPVRSNSVLYCTKIALVSASKRMSDTTPKSDSAYRATSSDDAASGARSPGSVTRHSTVAGEAPSDRAASSCDRSVRRSAAPHSRNT